MKPHTMVQWLLRARLVTSSLQDTPTKEAWDTGVEQSMGGAILRLQVTTLAEEVELWLKARLNQRLRRLHGPGWWASLPDDVVRAATHRYQWALRQTGPKRIGPLQDIAWLSLGDVIKVLNTLALDEWRACLRSETARRQAFGRALLTIKTFRDNRLAHPRPRPPSRLEIARLCRAVQQMAQAVRPTEVSETELLLDQVRSVPNESRKRLHHLAWWGDDPGLFESLVAKPDLSVTNTQTAAGKLKRSQIKWRTHLLTFCAKADPGGRILFGIER